MSLVRFSDNETGYVYTNTRVRVMKSELLTKGDFEKLIKMSVNEIGRFLQEKKYKKEFDELARTLSGVLLIEYALNKNLENQFSSILKFSVRSARKELNVYLKRFDIMNIKTILRGKLSGISNKSIMNEIISAGSLDKNYLQDMIEKSRNFEEAVEFLKTVEYYPILKKHQNDMPKLEDELDRHYFEKLLKGVGKPLADFSGYEIGAKNISVEVRARKHNVEFRHMRGGKKLKLDEKLKHDSIEFRKFLKKSLVNRALKMASKFTRDVTPVIGYFFAKENELSNIRMIVRGKEENLDEAAIRQQLILGE